MLQTKEGLTIFRLDWNVSSPQGNATNENGSAFAHQLAQSFKSPRECYKPLTASTIMTPRHSFKSPRECYKQHYLLHVLYTLFWFQVPKGMLQTYDYCDDIRLFTPVSSPQGNATNTWGSLLTFLPTTAFQVPKGMLQTRGWLVKA